ncbi:hypothetical protein ABFS82_05G008300 [Erythranthe guttata]|uniref:HTH myb-type domain-containing protein n=1 Tax=Erythranthe guttata TaxID=4155 RepID=A0A022Q7C2_ERYGU|nr:PREDICTED: putative Myb family transcription factor At1g14600 [Erythranthe guttata]EYU22410.1 hypothetical protein MIMGU_mgv1a010781mg [Erythranthe guttata]|eukprot:XP_012855374.1 PREDICTED: putative Myb family transcription factor At1g14600 [Erythranthe guttata]
MIKTKEMRLVLSSDAKPRLKWTTELHHRFIEAVEKLGGPDKATPKSLMRIMSIHGLTLYHLKSHLQKYRMGKNQHSQTYQQSKQEECEEKQRNVFTSKICDGAKEQINESVEITQALQMQMEAQRKLHEQIEVQRHLQLRIEAQGKYLQSVLRKAQETLSEYSSCSIEVEHAKAQLSQLMSMVDSGCTSSSFSILTQSDGSVLEKDERDKLLVHDSLESSLTSSESSWKKNKETRRKHRNGKITKEKGNSIALPLMEMHSSKRVQLLEKIDLNSDTMNEFDQGRKVIDLNINGVEFFNGNF